MNRFIIIAFLLITTVMAKAQTDSAENFQWPAAFRAEDSSSLIRLFPVPAKDNVFITVKNWDGKSRYTFLLLDGKGRPIKNLVLLQPQQLIPLRQSYGKGLLWVEVYKDRQIIGKEKLYVAERY